MYCEEVLGKFHNLRVLARRVLFQLHLWIGVITGLYIAVVCTTGAALVFRIDLQRALRPDLFTPKASGPPAHPADIMDSVKRAFPDDRVSGVDAPTTGRPTYLAYSSQGTRFRTLPRRPGTRSSMPLASTHLTATMSRASSCPQRPRRRFS